MLADEVDYVVGVDTHRDQHVLAIVAAPTGAVVAQRSFAANAFGQLREQAITAPASLAA
jgi:transposase